MSVKSANLIFGENNNIIISKFEVTQEKNINKDEDKSKDLEKKTIFIIETTDLKNQSYGNLDDNICIINQFSGEKLTITNPCKKFLDNKKFKMGFLNILNSIEGKSELIIPIFSENIPGNYCFDGLESHLNNYIINNENLKIIFILNSDAIEYIGKCSVGFDNECINEQDFKIDFYKKGIDFIKNFESDNISIRLSELCINKYIKSLSNKRKYREPVYDNLHISCSGNNIKTFLLDSNKFNCTRIGGEKSDIFPTYLSLSSPINESNKDITSTIIILFILDKDNLNDVKIKCQFNGNCSSLNYSSIEKYKVSYQLNQFYDKNDLTFDDFNILVDLTNKNLKLSDIHKIDELLLKKININNDFFSFVKENLQICFLNLLTNKTNLPSPVLERDDLSKDSNIMYRNVSMYNSSLF